MTNSKILESFEVDLGDRSIIYNRIETPALKPVPTDETVDLQASKPIVPPTAEELAEIARWEKLLYESLSGSAMAVAGKGSEVRLWTPDGEVVALSSIDFNHLRTVWGFEADGVYYSFFVVVLGMSKEEIQSAGQDGSDWLPAMHQIPQEIEGVSQFLVLSAPKGESGQVALQALEDLHAYYDTNRKALILAYEESEKARIAHEAWLRDNPPTPKDTVINYFPIQSAHSKKTTETRMK